MSQYKIALVIGSAAFEAIDFHRKLANVRALFAAFPSATSDRRWSLLIAILDAVDPYLYTDSEDELWLGRILVDGIPAVYERHANATLELAQAKGKVVWQCPSRPF